MSGISPGKRPKNIRTQAGPPGERGSCCQSIFGAHRARGMKRHLEKAESLFIISSREIYFGLESNFKARVIIF
jgi:hypothetical protein